MKNYKLHTSEGVRDFFGKELKIKKEIEKRLELLFNSYGYNMVETPMFEYLDVYTSSNGIQSPSLYNLINRQGELLALRNDMTLSIARIVSTKDTSNIYPKKYSYIADTFRYPRLYQGKSHVFTQAGIEIVGVDNVKADIECIKLAYEALDKINLKKFTVHIGSGTFIETLLKDFSLDDDKINTILSIIQSKDLVLLKNKLKEYNLDEVNISLIERIMRNAGKLNFIQSIIDDLGPKKESTKILEGLKSFYDELVKVGLQNRVVFDFSIYLYANYYTGLCFEVFADGIGQALISGGRCDNVLHTFGKDLAMIGFGFNVDAVIDYVISKNLIALEEVRYVSFTDHISHEYALKKNDELRLKGIVVEVSMYDTLKDTIKYAKEANISKVLEYKNNTLNEIEVL